MKRLLSIFSSIVAVVSCVYPYEVPELPEQEECLVVDGSIVLGNYASLNLRYINDSYTRPRAENWWVEDDQGTRYVASPGAGQIDLSQAPADRYYRMVMQVNGKTYSSSLEKAVDPPVLEKISFNAGEGVVNCNVSFKEGASATGFVALSYEEIWKFHTQLVDEYEVDLILCAVSKRKEPDYSRYWCWRYSKSIDETLVNLSYLGGVASEYPLRSFARGNDRNHGDYTIRVRARSISDAEYRFHNNLNTPSEGYNLFTPNPGEMAGNVRCEDDTSIPVMGYVTLSYSSVLEAHLDDRYYVAAPVNESSFIEPEPWEMYDLYYESDFRPVYSMKNDNMSVSYLWGPRRCIDCVADGGALDKPSFQ